jgi:hypothetical protein
METPDLDRIRFVTRRFNELQGLRYQVPIGLMTLSVAGAPLRSGWPLAILRAVLISGGLFLLLGAKRYYRTTFGEVERWVSPPAMELYPLSILGHVGPALRLPPVIPAVWRFLLALWLGVAVFFLFQILFWPPWIQVTYKLIWTGSLPEARALSAQVMYALFGSLFLGLWWLRERHPAQSYPLGIGILLSSLSVLGPWFVPEAINLQVALLLSGSSMVLTGLLDHWQLVRVLGRPRGIAGE